MVCIRRTGSLSSILEASAPEPRSPEKKNVHVQILFSSFFSRVSSFSLSDSSIKIRMTAGRLVIKVTISRAPVSSHAVFDSFRVI